MSRDAGCATSSAGSPGSRLGAVPFAVLEVALLTESFPAGLRARRPGSLTATFARRRRAALRRAADPRARPSRSLGGARARVRHRGRRRASCSSSPSSTAARSGRRSILVVVEAALRFGIRGGVLVPVARCCRCCVVARVAARRPVRPAAFDARPRHVPVRAAAAHRPDRRLARRRGSGARRRPREARAAEAERLRDAARPARRPARGGEPLRPRARLVARARRGVRRVHPRAARPRRRSTARRSSSPRATPRA